jgi:hypothetical protein
MALNASAWILGGTLLITAASTLAGCASVPLPDSRSAENAGTSKDIDGSINDSHPIAGRDLPDADASWKFDRQLALAGKLRAAGVLDGRR